MNELKWIAEGRKLIGTDENVNTSRVIALWRDGFTAIGQPQRMKESVWNTGSTAWCGSFVAACLARAGLGNRIPKSFPMARSWTQAGSALAKPAYGCVVVFTRTGGGHVGFVVGKDVNGNLMVLGGNQSNKVCIKPFATSRVLAYRWCGETSAPAEGRYDLPLLSSDGKVSTDEA
jgi:TIGR02594 family protein